MILYICIVMVWGKFVEFNFENFGVVWKERDVCVEESRFEGVLFEYLYVMVIVISFVGFDLDVELIEVNYWCVLL